MSLFPDLDLSKLEWEHNGRPKPHSQYRLVGTGWMVEHCGHQTALWPYVIVTPEGDRIATHNGRGFKTVARAKQEAERLHRERSNG